MSRQYVYIGGEKHYLSGSPIFHKQIKCSEIALQSHYLSAFQHLCQMYMSFCFSLQNALGVCIVLTDRVIIPPTLEKISSRYYVRQQLGSGESLGIWHLHQKCLREYRWFLWGHHVAFILICCLALLVIFILY